MGGRTSQVSVVGCPHMEVSVVIAVIRDGWGGHLKVISSGYEEEFPEKYRY